MIALLAEVSNEQVAKAMARPNVVSTLDGVTTALVAFVLVGLVMPHIVKKPRQFYLIVAAVILIILLHALTVMIQSTGFTVFAGVITGLLQVIGFGLAVMCTGGLAAKELAGELARSYEVMRRGEEDKEIIIPIEGARKKSVDEPEHVVYTIDTPPGPPGPKPPPGPNPNPPPGSGAIPLE